MRSSRDRAVRDGGVFFGVVVGNERRDDAVSRADFVDATYLGWTMRIRRETVTVYSPTGILHAVLRGVPAARYFIRELRKLPALEQTGDPNELDRAAAIELASHSPVSSSALEQTEEPVDAIPSPFWLDGLGGRHLSSVCSSATESEPCGLPVQPVGGPVEARGLSHGRDGIAEGLSSTTVALDFVGGEA